jgi:hypothetical protein
MCNIKTLTLLCFAWIAVQSQIALAQDAPIEKARVLAKKMIQVPTATDESFAKRMQANRESSAKANVTPQIQSMFAEEQKKAQLTVIEKRREEAAKFYVSQMSQEDISKLTQFAETELGIKFFKVESDRLINGDTLFALLFNSDVNSEACNTLVKRLVAEKVEYSAYSMRVFCRGTVVPNN